MSREFDRAKVLALIQARKAQDWEFVSNKMADYRRGVSESVRRRSQSQLAM